MGTNSVLGVQVCSQFKSRRKERAALLDCHWRIPTSQSSLFFAFFSCKLNTRFCSVFLKIKFKQWSQDLKLLGVASHCNHLGFNTPVRWREQETWPRKLVCWDKRASPTEPISNVTMPLIVSTSRISPGSAHRRSTFLGPRRLHLQVRSGCSFQSLNIANPVTSSHS